MPPAGIDTAAPLPASAMPRSRTTRSTASFTRSRARRRKRCRLPKFLSRGLSRRSMKRGITFRPPSPGFVDAHVPFHEPPNLPLGVAARHHPFQEVGVLLLGLGVPLGAEANHRQKVLDLAEHALFDDFSNFLVGDP